MRALACALAIGCGGGGAPPAEHAQSTTAALSLAADARMIAVPGGTYISGSTPEERTAAYDDYQNSAGQDAAREQRWFDREDDRQRASLPPFRIDLAPVTQAAYAELVATGAVPAPAIDAAAWQAQGFAQDYDTQVARFVWHDGRPPAGREDHPVVLVTQAEAERYCRWRGEQRGEARRLPSAAELEKAARGDKGIIYPWGNVWDASKLNSAVAGPKDTVAVGSNAASASPYGVLDLAGNVFHWTSTRAAEPSSTDGAKPAGPAFVVKGSAWDDYAGVGRGASRHTRPATARHVIVGFRCAADGAGAER